MIEKLGTPEAKFLSNPCSHMVKHLERMLNTNPGPLNIAEIGVFPCIRNDGNPKCVFRWVTNG